MARGGFRPNAGRKPDPNSARQKALARKGAKRQQAEPTEAVVAPQPPAGPPVGASAVGGWPFPIIEPKPDAKRKSAREYLAALVNDEGADERLRLDAAKKLIEFEESKPAPMGKKESKQEAARKASGGRFSAGKAPLALVKR